MLAPHSSPWNSMGMNGAGQQQGGGDPQPPVAHQGAAALADGPVADLVVVLGADHELVAAQPDRRAAVHALAVR